MRLRDFYTSIYNIRLGFIKIESKTGREKARTKSSKKTSLPMRGIPLPRRSKRGLEYGLGFA